MEFKLLAASLVLVLAPNIPSKSIKILDGDTISISGENIRLLGIDAPELRGHCRRGRICANGNPLNSKENLRHLIYRGQIQITRFGHDRYGRTLAMVRANGTDLSCAQLRAGMAIYKPQWDKMGGVINTCPEYAR